MADVSMDLIQIKVEPELKKRFQALVRGKKGINGTMSDAIRAYMIRECDKYEADQRNAVRAEEEHQAKLAALHRKSSRQAS